MYIILFSLVYSFSLQATISYLESYSRPKTAYRTLLAGEIHDIDPAGQRNILKQALTTYAAHSRVPLTLHIEDPLAIAGLETLTSPRGLLLGLANELQALSLPSFIQVHNFDTKKIANCAIHFFSQPKPELNEAIQELNELSFGHLISELEQAYHSYTTHPTIQELGSHAQKDCVQQLAAISAQLKLLEKNLIDVRISPSDSLAHTAVTIAPGIKQERIYKPLYQADVQLTSLAAIVTTLESKGNMALLCGERHAKDASRILEYEQWTDLCGPNSFTSNWLLHPNQ